MYSLCMVASPLNYMDEKTDNGCVDTLFIVKTLWTINVVVENMPRQLAS